MVWPQSARHRLLQPRPPFCPQPCQVSASFPSPYCAPFAPPTAQPPTALPSTFSRPLGLAGNQGRRWAVLAKPAACKEVQLVPVHGSLCTWQEPPAGASSSGRMGECVRENFLRECGRAGGGADSCQSPTPSPTTIHRHSRRRRRRRRRRRHFHRHAAPLPPPATTHPSSRGRRVCLGGVAGKVYAHVVS